jgi:cyanate permease
VTALLAHQGGWDEMLLVLAPIVLVAVLLWLAKRRVDRAARRRSDSLDASTDRG